ncbi:EAL domain-containing protein [Caballeronia sp. GACF4]|uniref:putative bifunctional diguanylate cyclase/phosphodiesterase n=1 Tax=Caballeronia sp. GACF4 TaxID=2921763 RepID=UPI0020296BE5|nr:EAL domain-containing protein [Caballeronia sp. GACF4]
MRNTLMQRLASSSRYRFVFFASTTTVLFFLAFSVMCLNLMRIARDADRIDDTWIANTRILGEMSDRVTELRLAQALLVLSNSREARVNAKTKAGEHRETLAISERAFLESAPSRSLAQAEAAFAALHAYEAAELAWEGDADLNLRWHADFVGETQALYVAADEALDLLINANANAAHSDTGHISTTSNLLSVSVIVIGSLVCVVTVFFIRRLDKLLFCPLNEITEALTQLSAGNGHVSVLSAHRGDEIGKLAKAFECFRQHADALRDAYVATKLAEEAAARIARHDSLTGLFNRGFVSARINSLSSEDASKRAHFLYVIDLDRFKPVNDLHGHAAGDSVLCKIAERLRGETREGDIVARLGGDEFAVLGHMDEDLDAGLLAARMLAVISLPVTVDNCQIEVGGSIGIARYGRDGVDADTLLRSADAAMYAAKSSGRGTFQFFQESMREAMQVQAQLEADVRNAVAKELIEPYYQPLVDLQGDSIYGFEVLARWTDERRGAVSPEIFIPVVERLGLATPFTISMLRRACRHAQDWPNHIVLALNVSPLQLADPLLPTQMVTVLQQEDFSPRRLEIEMTESALVDDLNAAKSAIDQFRALGIKVSLDDFGTGYSSLHHLRELKFDKVKIDKSFVLTMLSNPEHEKIVDAILNLSDGLGLRTLAEGIESQDVESALRARGCSFGQGYLFGKATSYAQVPAVLSENEGARKLLARSG